MPKTAKWKEAPEAHDFPAADDYLSLILGTKDCAMVIRQLKRAPVTHRLAKDILRASQLPLLPVSNVEVAKDLKQVKKGVLLSPVLLIRGDAVAGIPMTIADGYHRVCASYNIDETLNIPCLIADPPDRMTARQDPNTRREPTRSRASGRSTSTGGSDIKA
jgi:hypothetical protein